MLSLHVAPSDDAPFDHRVAGDSMTIGRSPGTDLAISDKMLSRHHARIFRTAEGWFLEDLGSRNGTFVNGERVRRIRALLQGDVIALGETVLRVTRVGEVSWGDSQAPEEIASDERTLYSPASELLEESIITQAEMSSRDEDSIRWYADRLRMLNDVHRTLCRPIDLEGLMEVILERTFDHLKPEQGAIFLRSPDGGFYRAADRSSASAGEEFVYSENLIREVAEKGMAALVDDTLSDDRFAGAQSLISAGIRSIVAAPLFDASGSLGMIALASNAFHRRFTKADMELLVSLASVAALRIRNMALVREAQERMRMEEELALARSIQVALLPESLPAVPGYEVEAYGVPSSRISGDYYEILGREGDGRCILMVADVSGHGFGAALLAASLEALCASPIEACNEPGRIFDRVAELLYRRSQPAKYATSFLASIEPSTGRVTYANAGHPPGLLLGRSGDVRWLGATGRPLALLPNSRYEQETVVLEPGDLLAVYTDGVTEAMNPNGEEYGSENLCRVLRDNGEGGLGELSRSLEKDLASFVEGAAFSDDRTWVFVRRLNPPSRS